MSKYTLIVKYLKMFESALDDQHELGLIFPDYGGAYILQSTASGANEFIAFDLLTESGESISVIQNYSQLNFAIVSCSKLIAGEEKRRMGFTVGAEADES